METFRIQITDDKAATNRLVSLLIALINLLAFSYLLFRVSGNQQMLAGTGLLMAFAAITLSLLRFVKRRMTKISPALFLLLSAVLWVLTGNYLVGICLCLFALLDLSSPKKKQLTFDEEGIRFPSFPAKRIQWTEVDFVILKDDILTIELRNNRLIQFTLEKHVSSGIDAVAFSHFCNNKTLPAGSV